MLTPIKVIHSNQTSVSPIAGTAGYLTTFLYAALETGFNTKTVSSITVTANVATVTTSTAHGYLVNDVVRISGANESVFNDDVLIATVPSTTTFTFALTTATASATGTISCCIAPLGFTRVYLGTNKAVFRAQSGSRLYLRIDDTNALYSVVSVYETMTTVDSGTNKMGDVYIKKSASANTTPVEFYLIGDDRTFYLFVNWNATACGGFAFGDFNSFVVGDVYNCLLFGYSASAPTYVYSSQYFTYVTFNNTYVTGQYLMKNFDGGTINAPVFKANFASGQMGYGTNFFFPNPLDGSMRLLPIELIESTSGYHRGTMRGLFSPLESSNGMFSSNDRTIVISGKTYLAIKLYCNASLGNCFLDITGPWHS